MCRIGGLGAVLHVVAIISGVYFNLVMKSLSNAPEDDSPQTHVCVCVLPTLSCLLEGG